MGDEHIVPERRRTPGVRKYVGYGVTAFCVIAAAVLLVFMFVRWEQFSGILDEIGSALAPVLLGIVFAYILNPLMNFFEKKLKPVFFKRAKKVSRAVKTVRAISIILTLICTLLFIGIIVYMLIPELVNTSSMLAENIPEQYEKFKDWFSAMMLSETRVGRILNTAVDKIYEFFTDFLNNDVMDYASNALGILASVGKGVMNVMGAVYNSIVGMIFAVYFLSSKEKFCAQLKKLIFAFWKRKKANKIIRVAKECHLKFSGSIIGKLLDSLIIGLLCFAGMLIMNLEYKPLISVVIGVTNVIPFFGPFIGAIPCAFLLLMVSPAHCLYFVIFIFILQQFDSNFLTPKILGDTIGLSSVWVLFSCVVLGSLFGLLGLLLGVPCLACIYMIFKEWVENRLKHKGLHTATEDYALIDSVDEHEMVLIEKNTEPEKINEDEYDQKIANENVVNSDLKAVEESNEAISKGMPVFKNDNASENEKTDK